MSKRSSGYGNTISLDDEVGMKESDFGKESTKSGFFGVIRLNEYLDSDCRASSLGYRYADPPHRLRKMYEWHGPRSRPPRLARSDSIRRERTASKIAALLVIVSCWNDNALK